MLWHGKYVPIFPLLEGYEACVISSRSERVGILRDLRRLGEMGEASLAVIEDVHLNPNEVNELLGDLDPARPKLLLTNRGTDYGGMVHRETANEIKRLSETAGVLLRPFDPADDIIRFYFERQGIEPTAEAVEEIKAASEQSLWLLAYALEAYTPGGGPIDRRAIVEKVRRDLGDLQAKCGHDPLYPRLLIALSVLFRYEIMTDLRFLEDKFGEQAQPALWELTQRGEVVAAEKGEAALFGLPHSALAEVYVEFATEGRWAHRAYQSPKGFLREYAFSSSAANGLQTFGPFIINRVWKREDAAGFELKAVTSCLKATADLWGTAFCIDFFREADPHRAQEIIKALDKGVLAKRIETAKDLGAVGWLIERVHSVDPDWARDLIEAMDKEVLAKRIETAEGFYDALKFIEGVRLADPDWAQELEEILRRRN